MRENPARLETSATRRHFCERTDKNLLFARAIVLGAARVNYRGRLYYVRDGGMVTSYDPSTGEVILDRERLGVPNQYVASPVASGGNIYAANATGRLVVFRAGDTLDVLARNNLGERITATPAILDGKLYVRTAKHLYAFAESPVLTRR